MRLLTLDTGKSHIAYATTCITDEIHLESLGTIPAVDDLTQDGIQQNIAVYDEALSSICNTIDVIVFERVIQRPGRVSGSSVEYIGVSVGVLLARSHDKHIRVIPTMASTWKTKLRKIKPWTTSSELFDFPPIVKTRKSNIIADHEFDATSIALWFIQKNNLQDTEKALKAFTEQLHEIDQARRDSNVQQVHPRHDIATSRTKKQTKSGPQQHTC